MMKNLLFTFILSLIGFSMNGQVSEQDYMLSLGNQSAFVMEHDGADKKTVEKILESAIKEFGKVKRNRKADEWNCLQCEVPGISGKTNVYFKIEESKGMTRSFVFFDDGTKFINSANDSTRAEDLKTRLTYVSHDIKRKVISEELKDEEDELKDFNKDLNKLEKKNKDLHGDIEEYKRKIAEAESDIEKNLQDQKNKNSEIENQKQVIEEVTDRLNSVGKK